jgi:hypothetical protein
MSTDCKAVADSREKIDLVRLPNTSKYFLRSVPLAGWEDGICLGSGDGKRTRDSGKLRFFDEGRMRNITGINTILVVTDYVLNNGISTRTKC